jgi:hypothetical protein
MAHQGQIPMEFGLVFPDGAHGSRQRAGRDDLPEHEVQGADRTITDAIDTHVQSEQHKDDDGGSAGVLVPAG